MRKCIRRSPNEQFLQAVNEVFFSIGVIIEKEPIYKHERILERIVEPERIFIFRVPWRDDNGNINVNTGYRIGFNSALGPYKAGFIKVANTMMDHGNT